MTHSGRCFRRWTMSKPFKCVFVIRPTFRNSFRPKFQIRMYTFEKRSALINKLIKLFRLFLCHPFKSSTTQRRTRHSTHTVSEFHAEAPQATASEGLAQDLYMATRAGIEPTTIRTIGVDSTNEPPRSMCSHYSADSVALID